MATQFTSLRFETQDQNLWGPGDAVEISYDIGDLLTYNPEKVLESFGVDAGIAGVNGEFYFDFKAGIYVYADLGSGGSFDGEFNIDVNVEFDGAIDVSNPLTQTVAFDFSDWNVRSAKIESEGFKIGRGVGLGFELAANAGVQNIEWWAFGASGEVGDINFINTEFRIPIIEITPQVSLEKELYDGLKVIGRLPTGADTQGVSFGQPSVSASGFSDTKFLELDVDVDELLLALIEKIPGVGTAIAKAGNIIFAEYEYDLADYIPIVPEEAIQLGVTLLDIGASAGLVLTEDVALDIGGGTMTPDIDIVLRSDNGTASLADDVVVTGKLGQTLNVSVPAPIELAAPFYGTQTVEAFFDIGSANFAHAMGVGIDAALTIEALKAEVKGDWIPDSLSIEFGPLLSIEIPDGGFQAKLFNFFEDDFELDTGGFTSTPANQSSSSWTYDAGVFNQQTDTYEVFVTAAAPAGWDPDAPNAQQVVYAYLDAAFENLAALSGTFSDLWTNGNQTEVIVSSGFNNSVPPSSATSDLTRIWAGDVSASTKKPDSVAANNFSAINVSGNPVQNADGSAKGLGFNVSHSPLNTNYNDSSDINAAQYNNLTVFSAGSNFQAKVDLLDELAGATVSYYSYDAANTFQSTEQSYASNIPVNVIGSNVGDVIAHVGNDGRPRLYDGGGEVHHSTYGYYINGDIFVADFAATHPNTPITFDAQDASYQNGVTIAGNITIKNFENFVLRTGSGDDFLTGGLDGDYFEAGGGNDFIRLIHGVGDEVLSNFFYDDRVYGQSGDDVLVDVAPIVSPDLILNAGVNPTGFNRLYGGTGQDLAIFELDDTLVPSLFGADHFAFTSFEVAPSGSFGGPNVTPFSSIATSISALQMHDGGGFGVYDPAILAIGGHDSQVAEMAPGHDDPVLLYQTHVTSGTQAGRGDGAFKSLFKADIESISYLGSDLADDAVLFTGGLGYDGGDGIYDEFAPQNINHQDTLVGDFGAYETRMGVSSGIVLIAEDRIGHAGPESTLSFGNSVIEGFERFVAKGTSQNDYFLGGKHDDYFHGGSGDDVIDGGEFEPFTKVVFDSDFNTSSTATETLERDVLVGGDGDDLFFWSDDGADRIDGDDGNAPMASSSHDRLNVAAEAGSLGLEYGLYDTTISFASTPVRTVFNAMNSNTAIRDALALLGDGTVSGGGDTIEFGTGIRFGNALGDYADAARFGPQPGGLSDSFMEFRAIEHVNVTGSDDFSDLVFYQGGATYLGGEDASDTTVDVFAADFSGQSYGIDFEVGDGNDAGNMLANGIFVGGFERAIILAGSGNDRLKGGTENDLLNGGDGSDILFGGGGSDLLEGGAGDDLVFWDGSGNVTALGGDGEDHIVIGSNGSGTSLFMLDINENVINTGTLEPFADQSIISSSLDQLPNLAYTFVFAGGNHVVHGGFEHASVAGTDMYDDFVLYQGGMINIAGERWGDNDMFAADLSAETADLTLIATDRTGVGQIPGGSTDDFSDDTGSYNGSFETLRDMGNGDYIGGFERFNIRLGSGNDRAVGGWTDDVILGGDGDDNLDGGGGGTAMARDFVDGGEGNDTLTFSGGFATYLGGGNQLDWDQLDFLTPTDAITMSIFDLTGNPIGGTYSAGAGGTTDRASLSAMFAAYPSFEAVQYDFTGGSLRFSDIELMQMRGSDQDDFLVSVLRYGNLFGGDGDDVLASSFGNDMLLGGAGFDTYAFRSGFGADTIIGEDANGGRLFFDGLNISDIAASVVNGVDLVIEELATGSKVTIDNYFALDGVAGLNFVFDFVDYTGLVDVSGLAGIMPTGPVPAGLNLVGDANNDDFSDFATVNNDTYDGLQGDDYFASSNGQDMFIGGPGSDTVSYAEYATDPVSVSLIYNTGYLGNANGDYLIGIENLIGTDFDDVLQGQQVANTIFGLGGDDIINGDSGRDTLIGNEDNDTIHGNQDDDKIFGDTGADNLFGDEGDDYVVGGAGNDALEGGIGRDVLVGGAGDDTANGGDGDDTYIYDGDNPATDAAADPANNEAGFDVFDGGAGTDTLDLRGFDFSIDVYMDSIGYDVFTDFATVLPTGFPAHQIARMPNTEQVIGSDFADRFYLEFGGLVANGAAGDDLFTGNSGNQTFIGGAGFDTVDYSNELGTTGGVNSDGGIIVEFETSQPNFFDVQDTFGDFDLVAESTDKFIGTARDDQFSGHESANTFEDGDGADLFFGFGGDDTIIADAQGNNDRYFGGEGFDTLDYSSLTGGVLIDVGLAQASDRNGGTQVGGSSGLQSDLIFDFERFVTGAGDDIVQNVSSASVFDLGAGDDVAEGSANDDEFIGGLGTDTYRGFGGHDLVDYSVLSTGFEYNPAFFGPTNNVDKKDGTFDTISDIEGFVGSMGDDAVYANNEDNVFYYQGEAGQGGNDFFAGGGGTDTIDLSGFGAAVQIDPLNGFIKITTRDADSMDPAHGPSRNILNYTGVEYVIATAFADVYFGSDNDDVINGRDGNDILIGRDGDDELRGGNGNDTVDYSQETGGGQVVVDMTGFIANRGTPNITDTFGETDTYYSIENVIGTNLNDIIVGDGENNVINGLGGIDELAGLGGDDIIFGGDAADKLYGFDGNDTLHGQNDDDEVYGHDGDDVLSGGAGNDLLDGGNGIDVADYSEATSAVTVNLNSNVNSKTGGLGTDTYVSIEGAIGSAFNDKFFGLDDANLFRGGDGADTFSSFGGDDVLIGDGGNDRMFAGEGNDIAEGGEGADTLNGQAGDDKLVGGLDNDRLYGGVGNDVLLAGDGADLLVGGTGNDMINGGAGNDRLYVDGEDDPDGVFGGLGSDRLIGQGSLSLNYVLHVHGIEGALGASGDDFFDGSRLAQRTVLVGKDGNDIMRGGEGNDLLEGRDDNDTLSGNRGVDYLAGQNGDDILDGGLDNDTLFGGAGDDVLTGGGGNDFIQGDAGSDVINGGDGDDDIRIDSADIAANISGGNGTDTVRLLGSDNFGFDLGAQGFERGFGNSGDNVLDGSTSTVGVTLYGLNGNDTLIGSALRDSLIASNGDDIVHVGFGADSANGGAGSDTAVFAGNQADYTVNIVSAGVTTRVIHDATGDVNTLSAFEFAQFDDGTIAI